MADAAPLGATLDPFFGRLSGGLEKGLDETRILIANVFSENGNMAPGLDPGWRASVDAAVAFGRLPGDKRPLFPCFEVSVKEMRLFDNQQFGKSASLPKIVVSEIFENLVYKILRCSIVYNFFSPYYRM